MTMQSAILRTVVLGVLTLACTGCISTGETIRVRGEVVDKAGQRIADAAVTGTASKRGGTIIRPGERNDPNENESREVSITNHGDGTFTAASRWAGTLTLSVEGYKIRRVDDIGTVFLVPSRSFFQSADQIKLEVIKDE